MNRVIYLLFLFVSLQFACAQKQNNSSNVVFEVQKSDSELRKQLTPLQYSVAIKRETERPFTGQFWNKFDKGTYSCIVCHQPLFSSTSKFESGCGWPSFNETLIKANVLEVPDNSLGMQRIEVKCKRCGAHLGHVFNDGPPPTGIRYCINSASLLFKETK